MNTHLKRGALKSKKVHSILSSRPASFLKSSLGADMPGSQFHDRIRIESLRRLFQLNNTL